MPSSKMRDGMKPLVESANKAKEALLYKKHRREFELGILSKEILNKLSIEHQKEYFDAQFMRKYKRRIVWQKDNYTTCIHCIYAGFYESGYVSDAQVRILTRLQHKTDLETLQSTYPSLCIEMDKLNPGILNT